MAIRSGTCWSFALELPQKVHNLASDTLKIALYTSSATLDPSTTTAYSATNEASGTGYSAGGATLSSATISQDATTGLVYIDFASPSWPGSSISANGALIYNSTASNKAIAIIDFGATITSIAGTFTVTLPPNTAQEAIIRIPVR